VTLLTGRCDAYETEQKGLYFNEVLFHHTNSTPQAKIVTKSARADVSFVCFTEYGFRVIMASK